VQISLIIKPKTFHPTLKLGLTAFLCLTCAALSVNAQKKKKGSNRGLQWRIQQLHKDNNEGLAVGDINGDGKLDISAGEFWYAGPDYKQYSVRKLVPFGKDYLQNNGEHRRDTDIGNTLHKDIGNSFVSYVVVRFRGQDLCLVRAESVASWRPSPKGCRAAARPERSDGLSGREGF